MWLQVFKEAQGMEEIFLELYKKKQIEIVTHRGGPT